MGQQPSFSSLAWSRKGKVTRRERFLAEMDRIIPWPRFVALIERHCPQAGRRRRFPPLETMLRIYFLQQWFDLPDPLVEDELYDSETMLRFVGVELGEGSLPDETTILRFRHLLERHDLTTAILGIVEELLRERGLLVRNGTIWAPPCLMRRPSGRTRPASAVRR